MGAALVGGLGGGVVCGGGGINRAAIRRHRPRVGAGLSWSRAAAAGVPGVGAFGYGIRGVLPLRMESAVVSGEVWGSEWGSEESVAAAIRNDSVVVVGG